jgi:hypothetical protein
LPHPLHKVFLAPRQRDHQSHRIAVMLFDPRTSAKPSHAIAVEQRRLGERFLHAENVTGFYAPSNLEKPLVIKRFFHIRLRIHPQNSAMSQN